MSNLKTAESVSPKHPDKICDQISDAILDAHLAQDPLARCAIDVAGGHGKLFITGEVTSRAKNINVAKIVKRLAGNIEVIENLESQSSEIAQGVDTGGAGDQGIMVGYATSETEELIPLEVKLARALNMHIYQHHPYDGKTQVTLRDSQIIAVVASFQHVKKSELQDLINDWLLEQSVSTKPAIHANPAGDWDQGGFDADAGLTGRKLAVDNYGPRIPIGGGAFSGKDPSKVDRSAAYMARYIAVDKLKEFKAREVYVYLAYAIGYNQPLEASLIVDGKQKELGGYNLSPEGIIQFLDLRRPMYETTARYGHFGHSSLPWERW